MNKEHFLEERKNRMSLTALFSAVAFFVMFLSLSITTVAVFLLYKIRILPDAGSASGALWLLFFMATASLIIGTVTAIFVMKFPLKPLNRLINHMNRLAAGDFKTRLHFGKRLSSLPAFSELEGSFNKLAEELDSTEMLRSDFINNFSHEFKTPIVSIAGFAKVLKRGKLDEKQREEYISIIEEESMRLSYMATNVLNLTKVENQTILTGQSRFNLSEQIRSAVLLLENEWSRKGVEIDLELEEYGIEANEELLKQVWINLLDNAVKFSPEGGRVGISADRKEDELIVSISNEGEIREEHIDKLFRKFYQADRSHSAKGNGIGLAIVKHVVELHGGRVTVKSADGKVTFCVALKTA